MGPASYKDVNSTFQFQLRRLHTTLKTGNSERQPYIKSKQRIGVCFAQHKAGVFVGHVPGGKTLSLPVLQPLKNLYNHLQWASYKNHDFISVQGQIKAYVSKILFLFQGPFLDVSTLAIGHTCVD